MVFKFFKVETVVTDYGFGFLKTIKVVVSNVLKIGLISESKKLPIHDSLVKSVVKSCSN